MNEWLTSTDIAQLTGLKTDTIYTYRKRNTLPKPDQHIGRTPVWKQATIDEWIKEREVEIRSTTERKDNDT